MSASKWKPYPEYQDFSNQYLSKIPRQWLQGRLKFNSSISARIGWKGLKASDYVESSDFAFLSIPNLKPKQIDFENVNYIEEHLYLDSPSLILKKGDVLLAKVGATLGIVNIVETLPINSTVNGSIAVLRPIDLIPKFFKYYIESDLFQTYLQVYKTGMGVPSVTQEALGEFPIFIPPKKTQKQIVEILDMSLDKIDSLILSCISKCEKLEEKRSALITQTVTKGLNPDVPMKDSEINWIGEIPENWLLRKVRNISRVVRGQTPRPGGDPRFFNGQHMPWITVAEVTKDSDMELTYTRTYLTEEGVEHSIIFDEGTFLLTNSGATLGVPKILAIKGCMNDGVAALLDISSEVSKEFLYYFFFMMTETLREQMKGSGQPNLNTTIIGDLPFAIPPLDEQNDIVNEVKGIIQSINHSISLIGDQIKLLKEYRTSLISAIVTGQIDVRSL